MLTATYNHHVTGQTTDISGDTLEEVCSELVAVKPEHSGDEGVFVWDADTEKHAARVWLGHTGTVSTEWVPK